MLEPAPTGPTCSTRRHICASSGLATLGVAGGTAADFADVDSIRKDLATMVAEGKTRGASLPLAERTLAVYDEAAKDGWGKRDGASLPAYWPTRSRAGEKR